MTKQGIMTAFKRILIDLLVLIILIATLHGGCYLYESYHEKLNDSLVRACIGSDPDAVRKLLDKGANPNACVRSFYPAIQGTTALMIACTLPNPEIVRLLLSSGANPDLADVNDFTPLMAAQLGGNIDIVRQLIEAGADINEVDEWHRSALEMACQAQRVEAAKLLLKFGANPNVDHVIHAHSAPLIHACRFGKGDLAKELLEKGADVYVTDGKGETPLSWAIRMGHNDIADMLREWQANHPKPPPAS